MTPFVVWLPCVQGWVQRPFGNRSPSRRSATGRKEYQTSWKAYQTSRKAYQTSRKACRTSWKPCRMSWKPYRTSWEACRRRRQRKRPAISLTGRSGQLENGAHNNGRDRPSRNRRGTIGEGAQAVSRLRISPLQGLSDWAIQVPGRCPSLQDRGPLGLRNGLSRRLLMWKTTRRK